MACLWQLRHEADRAEQARASGTDGCVGSARSSARQVLDRVAVLLLQAETQADDHPVATAISATCAAEFARVEGRDDASRWKSVADAWERAGSADEATYARQRAASRRSPVREPR